MASLIRRIQRQLSPSAKVHPILNNKGEPTGKFESHPARNKFYMGRGQKLGVTNPKCKALLARLRRDKKWGRK